MKELDKVAGGLAELRDAGVVVLWRPWQEMSYPEFWWGKKAHPNNPEPFRKMWKHMFNYFTNEKGLNNLLWVYSPADTDRWVPLDFYYPGDAYVDIVGVSVFDTQGTIRWNGYNRLVALGKPVYLTAVGDAGATAYNVMIQGMQTTQPRLFGFNIWFSTAKSSWALVDKGRNARALLEHPLVITRDEIDWRSEPMPPPSDTFVIDNTDTEFSVNPQDAWKEWTEVGGSNYGDSHHAHREIGTGQDTATWSFTVPKPGNYDVYAWWQAAEWRPPDVPYTVNYFGGSKTVKVDQRVSGSQWNLLGTFYFLDEGSVMVSDAVSSGRGVVADAIRLVYSSGGPLPTTTPTLTPTSPPTPTATNTPLPTYTPTPTSTSIPSPTNSPTPTNTPDPTATSTPLPTNTPTFAPTTTPTLTPTSTPRPTAIAPVTPTSTPVG
jgi:hypothetical protein